MVEHGQQFFNQGGAGVLRGFDPFAGGAFFEIFKIGGGAQQPVPVFVGLGGAGLEVPRFVPASAAQWRPAPPSLHFGGDESAGGAGSGAAFPVFDAVVL